MSHRNAFAHGTLSADTNRVWLSYFERQPRKSELTDEFLTEVESTLRNAHDATFALAQRIGTVKQSGSQEQT